MHLLSFTSLRQKLLFWFLVFISSNAITVIHSINYMQKRERIANSFRKIEKTHTLLLEDYKIQTNFFFQETRNPFFYEFGVSQYIDRHKKLMEGITVNLQSLLNDDIVESFELVEDINGMISHIAEYDTTLYEIIHLIRRKGFKDHNLIGEMRVAAHELEQTPGIDVIKLLNIRRSEKDFLLRYETIYLRRINNYAREIRQEVAANPNLRASTKETIYENLNNYLAKLNEVVRLERAIGLKDNSGLKLELDTEGEILAVQFGEFLAKATARKEETQRQLKITFIGLGIVFVALSIIVSLLIARRITRPLIDLTSYITRFVDSNFTFDENKSITATDDEIGKLTANFTVMRDKIMEQLKFFKQKVEERTEELAEANKKLVQINEANKRFVPIQFINFLGRQSIIDLRLGDNVQTDMSILFSDIRSFTEHSESLTPQQNFDFINTYLSRTAPLVREHGGFIDKYIGDSVMALFPSSPDDSVRAAISSQRATEILNQSLIKDGGKPIQVGIGIHFGRMILGTIGAENRMETTVISDAVNTAARLEGLTKIYGGNIIVSREVIEGLHHPDQFRFRYLDIVKVKGKNRSNEIYEILDGLRGEELALKLKTLDAFNKATALFQAKDLEGAIKLFQGIVKTNPYDRTAQLYLDRCHRFIKDGLPRDWDGTEKMKTK